MTNSLVLETSDKSREIEQKIQEFFDKVNQVISWVPWPASELLGPIQDGMERLAQKMREFWDRVNQLFEQPGNSDRLREAGAQWAEDVGNILGDIAGTVALDKLQTNIEWTGRAAEAYKATVPAQGEALNGLKDLAIEMRTSLDSLAESIDNFWLAMKIAFVTFVVAIVGAIVAAATVVGIPAAIAVILTAVGVCLGVVTATIMALDSHIDTIHNQQTTIQQKVRDVGTEWAKTNIAAMSDASVTDGDGSDWRPQR
ncbi:MAG TPA: hypothetical protein VHH34_01470 [Pseudonocardiaceae bacterium]|nr:hypothetical protein [Pseudonocardiaceae bacterium]